LLANGCTPCVFNKGNGHTQSTYSQPKVNDDVPSNGNGNGHEHSFCPIHECEMRKWEKNGRVWYSHKVGNEWCSGKAKNK
jgi:hypothetical protein